MFFTLHDNFEQIIKNNLKKQNLEIKKIPTGWTNYVFLARVNKFKAFIFRFPRNSFFADTLLKEEVFCKFAKGKISYKVPNIKIYYENNRPYSRHKFIQGKSLTEAFEYLSNEERTSLGKDIAKCIFQIQKLQPKNMSLPKLSEFLQGLSEVDDSKNYDLSKHDYLVELEKECVLCHADFNPGNILLNKKNKMIAVLDFAFASYSSPIIDISRIIGRSPKCFGKIFFDEYCKFFNVELDYKKIVKIIKVWNYVEEKYIEYMAKNHPDVILPF